MRTPPVVCPPSNGLFQFSGGLTQNLHRNVSARRKGATNGQSAGDQRLTVISSYAVVILRIIRPEKMLRCDWNEREDTDEY